MGGRGRPWSKSGTAPSRASARSTTRHVDYLSIRAPISLHVRARSAASATTSTPRCHPPELVARAHGPLTTCFRGPGSQSVWRAIGDPRALHSRVERSTARARVQRRDHGGRHPWRRAAGIYACDSRPPSVALSMLRTGQASPHSSWKSDGLDDVKRWLGRPFAENKRNKRVDEIHGSFTVVNGLGRCSGF